MSDQVEIQSAGFGSIHVVNGIAYATDKDNNVVPFAGFVEQDDPPDPGDGGNGGEGYPVVRGTFTVDWRLQSASTHPNIGHKGEEIGRYRVSPDKVDLWFRVKPGAAATPDNPGGSSPGVPSGAGTSRYYFNIPESVPAPLDQAIGGNARAWIAGTGDKEFTGAPGLSGSIGDGRAIVITLGGKAWGISHPKKFGPTSHITVHVTYPR